MILTDWRVRWDGIMVAVCLDAGLQVEKTGGHLIRVNPEKYQSGMLTLPNELVPKSSPCRHATVPVLWPRHPPGLQWKA